MGHHKGAPTQGQKQRQTSLERTPRAWWSLLLLIRLQAALMIAIDPRTFSVLIANILLLPLHHPVASSAEDHYLDHNGHTKVAETKRKEENKSDEQGAGQTGR